MGKQGQVLTVQRDAGGKMKTNQKNQKKIGYRNLELVDGGGYRFLFFPPTALERLTDGGIGRIEL